MPRTVPQTILARYSSRGKITHKSELLHDDDYTIITRYQSILQGIYNFYCMTANVGKRMAHIRHILETSLTKTLASKHQISVAKVFQKHRAYNPVTKLVALRTTVERPDKAPLTADFGGIPLVRQAKGIWDKDTDFQYEKAWFHAGGQRSEIIHRMLAEKCELCGATGTLQMHHVRKLADLDKPGRTPKPTWAKIMSARKRKSLAVCEKCHIDIHSGRHDGNPPGKLTGEPCASKVARTVRGGAVGKGDQK
jgi:hypothetical protein